MPVTVGAGSKPWWRTYGTRLSVHGHNGEMRVVVAPHLYGFRARYSHTISSIEQFVQGGPDLARLHLTFRLWQALQAPPRRFRVDCRLAAGVVGSDMVDCPREWGLWKRRVSR